jgi:hypothetical protein
MGHSRESGATDGICEETTEIPAARVDRAPRVICSAACDDFEKSGANRIRRVPVS